MGFFSEFSKAVKGEDAGERYVVAGREVACSHCGGKRFFEGTALLDSRFASYVGYDWASKGAVTLTCCECGHVEWFADQGLVEKA